MSVGQKFHSGLAGWFCLRFSHEVAGKVRSGLQSSGDFTGAGGFSSKTVHPHGDGC